jgi:hypothetical protein
VALILPKTNELFSFSSAKASKSATRGGVFNGVQYFRSADGWWIDQGLADGDASMDKRHTLCVHASPGCRMALRLNGTSDIVWEAKKYRHLGPMGLGMTVFEHWPDLQFYDYTKHAARMWKTWPGNYYLTLSAAEDNLDACYKVLDMQAGNVAMVFPQKQGPKAIKGLPSIKKLPTSYAIKGKRFKVIDGDWTDLRYLDKPARGVIVGLHYKPAQTGKGTKRTIGIEAQEAGFVRAPNPLGLHDDMTAYTHSQVVFDPVTGDIYA